jgi:hypothetical protein
MGKVEVQLALMVIKALDLQEVGVKYLEEN